MNELYLENCLETFKLAVKYDCSDLENISLAFIKENVEKILKNEYHKLDFDVLKLIFGLEEMS